jgi:hypothetical protein
MNPELTCAIVRDLLPSYVEGLTSRETAAAVEAHLAACPDCARLRAELSAPQPAPAETVKEVDYLKKIRRRNRRRVAAAVLCTVVLAAGCFAARLFFIGTAADPEGMRWDTAVQGGSLRLTVSSHSSANAYWGWRIRQGDDGVVNVSLREVLVSAVHRDGVASADIPLEGVTEVRLLGQVIWQDGLSIDRDILRLYEARTSCGDGAAAVETIAGLLEITERCGSYTATLRASEHPWTWTLAFTKTAWPNMNYSDVNWEMETWTAPLLLALVDDLDQVSWTYPDASGETQTRTVTVEDAACWGAAGSIRDCAESPAALQRLKNALLAIAAENGGDAVEEPDPTEPAGGYHFVT